jgi:hypothetical protein
MATAELAAGTAGIDPAAPRPPVGFRLQLPEAWTTADLHPASSAAWMRTYVRDRLGAAPETAGQRARARRGLGALLDGCRAQGVLVLLLLAGPAPGRQPSRQVEPDNLVAASLTLAWRRLAGTDHIDVDGIAETLAAAPPAPGEAAADRIVAVIDLPAGPAAYLHQPARRRPGQTRRPAHDRPHPVPRPRPRPALARRHHHRHHQPRAGRRRRRHRRRRRPHPGVPRSSWSG